jgi:MFS family permease
MVLYYGNVVVAASFMTHFFVLGAIYSGGIYVLPIGAELQVNCGAASWTVSLWMGVMLGGSFFSGRLLDKVDPRLVFALGGALAGCALVGLSHATTLAGAIACSFCVGASFSLCGAHSASVVQPWFRARRGTATGIAMMGSGAGHFVLTMALQPLLEAHGWRMAMRIEAAVVAAGIMATALLLRRPRAGEVREDGGGGGGGDGSGGGGGGGGAGAAASAPVPAASLSAELQSIGGTGETSASAADASAASPAGGAAPAPAVETAAAAPAAAAAGTAAQPAGRAVTVRDLLRTRALSSVCLFKFTAAFGYSVPFVHLPAMVVDAGFSEASGSRLLAVMGVASLCGRVVLGMAADRCGRVRVYKCAIGALAAAALLWPETAPALAAIAAFAVAYGFAAGAYPSLHTTIIADFFAAEHGDKMFSLLGCSFASDVLGAIVGPPIAGTLFDEYGSYRGAAYYTAGCLLVGVYCLTRIPSAAEHRDDLARVLARRR